VGWGTRRRFYIARPHGVCELIDPLFLLLGVFLSHQISSTESSFHWKKLGKKAGLSAARPGLGICHWVCPRENTGAAQDKAGEGRANEKAPSDKISRGQ
jgi:hypothetical protein